MQNRRVKLNSVCLASTISALANQGQWDLATDLFRGVRKEGIRNVAFTYRIITSAVTTGKDCSPRSLLFLNEVLADAALSNVIFENTAKGADIQAKNEELRCDSYDLQDDDIVSNEFEPLYYV